MHFALCGAKPPASSIAWEVELGSKPRIRCQFFRRLGTSFGAKADGANQTTPVTSTGELPLRSERGRYGLNLLSLRNQKASWFDFPAANDGMMSLSFDSAILDATTFGPRYT